LQQLCFILQTWRSRLWTLASWRMHEEFVSKSWRSYVSFLLLSLDFFWKSSQEYLGKQLDKRRVGVLFQSTRFSESFQKSHRGLRYS
jgi:hypothetical protein